MIARVVTRPGSLLAAGLLLAAALSPGPGVAGARARPTDQVSDAPLSVLQRPEILDAIGRDVSFRFAAAAGPTPRQGRVLSTRKVLNSGNPQRDCEKALVKSLQAMAKKARGRGARGIVGIRSFWDGFPTSSDQTYKCARGDSTTGVSLVGVLEEVK